MKHVADPALVFGPLFDLPERVGPNLSPSRLSFEGPQEDAGGRRERRLGAQLAAVFDALRGGKWRSLAELSGETGAPAASVSAQLRHLRKARYGAYVVERRHVGRGTYQYRIPPDKDGCPRRQS